MERQKLQFADALRGFAILGVIIVHVSQHATGLPQIVEKIFGLGAKGVLLFYLASAFTLFLSLSNRSKKEVTTLNYFIRRFFRIAPLYYLAIIVYLFANGLGPRYWLGDLDEISATNILSHFLFINGFNPYWINSIIGVEWSIAIETVFYLFVPFLFSKIKNLYQAIVFTAITLLMHTGLTIAFANNSFISDQQLWNNYISLWLPNQLPIFALGIVFFFIWKNSTLNTKVFELNNRRVWPLILIISLSGVLVLIGRNTSFIIGLCFLLFAYFLAVYQPKLLVNRLWGYIGKISYSMYLTHFLVLQILDETILGMGLDLSPMFSFVVLFFLTTFLTIGISALTYKFIEVKGTEFGKKIIKMISSRKTVHEKSVTI